ncbi:hypothetical protein EZV62_008757 [Acer yangbiense]|uniref:Uncharacterized protein n=1 Tax=Acer yangbiense TaxID=1000413 RepID=A0A5C7IEU3_9ROSI|nr:hypothetical protein EZV62_008757 [Acer yangbiense]
MAKDESSNDTYSRRQWPRREIAIAGGLISTPVIGWPLYTLKTTGYGLPPGPGGSIGALEGVSYLVTMVGGLKNHVTYSRY